MATLPKLQLAPDAVGQPGSGLPPGWAEAAETAANAVEIFGLFVILIGVAIATVRYARRLVREPTRAGAYKDYRSDLGRGILLGLELLVAADIIATVTSPLSFRTVGLLALVVVIRTFLSFALETEIEGTPPWRRRAGEDGSSAA